jgi:hypothetical protein
MNAACRTVRNLVRRSVMASSVEGNPAAALITGE